MQQARKWHSSYRGLEGSGFPKKRVVTCCWIVFVCELFLRKNSYVFSMQIQFFLSLSLSLPFLSLSSSFSPTFCQFAQFKALFSCYSLLTVPLVYNGLTVIVPPSIIHYSQFPGISPLYYMLLFITHSSLVYNGITVVGPATMLFHLYISYKLIKQFTSVWMLYCFQTSSSNETPTSWGFCMYRVYNCHSSWVVHTNCSLVKHRIMRSKHVYWSSCRICN